MSEIAAAVSFGAIGLAVGYTIGVFAHVYIIKSIWGNDWKDMLSIGKDICDRPEGKKKWMRGEIKLG